MIEYQAHIFIALCVFQGLVGCIRKTYFILAIAGVFNLGVNHFVSVNSDYLILAYGALNLLTAYALVRLGDIHIDYQSLLLMLAIIISAINQYDISNGTSFVYDVYVDIIAAITLFQIIGGLHDGLDQYKCSNHNFSS